LASGEGREGRDVLPRLQERILLGDRQEITKPYSRGVGKRRGGEKRRTIGAKKRKWRRRGGSQRSPIFSRRK